MNGDLVPFLIAIVGVTGTLISALLTQRISMRSKERELEHLRRENQISRQIEEERRGQEIRRSCYVSLNQLARKFHSVMFVYRQERAQGIESEAQEATLEEARFAYQEIYSEAQMIVPSPVLKEAHETNASLMRAYELIKGSNRDTLESPSGDPEEQLRSASRHLSLLRNSLRSDLGLDEL
ncbi:hypothetical protein [Streptomyces termitum]|uniref:hypothetical protein n=1 Tax=Streptomyces termitum TaxID=67368 RepID=UPI0033BB8001